MIPFLRTFAWQIGAVAAGAALIVSSGFLVAAQVENRRITELNRVLDERITHPTTGYVVRLAQAQTNAETVKAALEKQVADLKLAAAQDAAKLAETERKLAAAQRDTEAARRQVAEFLSLPPQGDTLEQRIQDVDARFLEMLK